MKNKITLEANANYVKNLRTLLESEVDEAEIIIAVRGIGKNLQEMIEKIGRMQNEDLPPLTDEMRDTHGPMSANKFHEQASSALQSALDSLYASKDVMDGIVTKLAGLDSLEEVDMDLEVTNMGSDDIEVEDEISLDDEIDAFAGDVAASGAEDEPLGRARMESIRAKMEVLEGKIRTLKSSA